MKHDAASKDAKRIAIAGAGYVGLAMATLLAKSHDVELVDIDAAKVDSINRWISPISDPEIEAVFAKVSENATDLSLAATLDSASAYKDADIVVIATPTDYDPATNNFDTSLVESAINAVRAVNNKAWIVIKSTVPVGYTRELRNQRGDERIVFSPEFLREGRALYDNLHPSRIVVGANLLNDEAVEFAHEFARLLAEGAEDDDVMQLVCGATEAEAIKLFANTYLALRVSYFNELDTYAAMRGLDPAQIIAGVGADPRIGNHYNNPSFGYGGYCLPKDTKQLLANYADVPQDLISAIVSANDTRKEFIASEIAHLVEGIDHPLIGIYRLTMKSKSDNFRQSSIQGIMQLLRGRGFDLLVYEPTYDGQTFLGCEVTSNLENFKRRSDVILVNRVQEELEDVSDKVYTRDIFKRD